MTTLYGHGSAVIDGAGALWGCSQEDVYAAHAVGSDVQLTISSPTIVHDDGTWGRAPDIHMKEITMHQTTRSTRLLSAGAIALKEAHVWAASARRRHLITRGDGRAPLHERGRGRSSRRDWPSLHSLGVAPARTGASMLRQRYLFVSGALIVVLALSGVPRVARAGTTVGLHLTQARRVNGQIAYNTDTGVFTVNPDGRSARRLLVGDGACCGDWSPNGTKLVVPSGLSDGRIGTAIVNADGTGYTPFPIGDPTLNIGCATGSWAPNGTRLACESWDDAHPARNGIYTISSADGSGLTRVSANPLGGHDLPDSYAPDGRRIVFTRYDANGHSVGLFVVKTNGGQLRRILPASVILNDGVQADWSPQRNEIIVTLHVTPHTRGSIWVVHADGSGLHEINVHGLACGGSVSNPKGFTCHGVRWSPDGTKIIFVAKSAATGQNIYTANADGSGLTWVTFDGNDDDPAWGTHPAVG